jgi:hypothetical protein
LIDVSKIEDNQMSDNILNAFDIVDVISKDSENSLNKT